MNSPHCQSFSADRSAPATVNANPPNRSLLSLCMIVRDSTRTLEACLESIRSWVDEMIVVDTGSVDQTPQLAASLGARVFHFPWCDDFATARNESLRHASGAWIFWMDADDTIDSDNGRKLRQLVEAADLDKAHSPVGYVMQVHCPGAFERNDADATVVDHIKLFRNLPELRFEGRIHEQVLPSIRRIGGDIGWTDIHVIHSGSDRTSDGRRRKMERDLRLLELDRRDRPNHPFVLFNLGMTYADAGHEARAIEALEACLATSNPGESHLRKAYALLVTCRNRMGQTSQACETCEQGLALYSTDPELLFLRGVLFYQSGQPAEAARAFRSILDQGEAEQNRYFSSIDRGIVGFKAHHNLALALRDLGDLRDAEFHWRITIRQAPEFAPAYASLVDLQLRMGKPAAAQETIHQMEHEAHASENREVFAELASLRAAVMETRGQIADARNVLVQAIANQPDSRPLLQSWSRYLFEHGRVTESLQAITRILALEPNDAAAYHNQAALYARIGLYMEALRACDASLALRPQSSATRSLRERAIRGAAASAKRCGCRSIDHLDDHNVANTWPQAAPC